MILTDKQLGHVRGAKASFREMLPAGATQEIYQAFDTALTIVMAMMRETNDRATLELLVGTFQAIAQERLREVTPTKEVSP